MGILDNGKSFEGEIGIWMVSLGVKKNSPLGRALVKSYIPTFIVPSLPL